MRRASLRGPLLRAAAMLALLFSAPALAGSELIIANRSVPASSLELSVVREIFLGKKSLWDNGEPVVLVALKRGATHEAFLQKVLARTAAQFTNVWKQAIFTGTGVPPKAFETEADVVRYVASTKGAIGYVEAATPHDTVKVIELR
ncbi:MAG: hypothetical protein HY900_18740 [Deltaproteobacteria bacterium]|nr:hypothetical protein [Deltaproteobacteria bacterium]